MKKILETKDIITFEGANKKGERFLEKYDKRFNFKSRFYPGTGMYNRRKISSSTSKTQINKVKSSENPFKILGEYNIEDLL